MTDAVSGTTSRTAADSTLAGAPEGKSSETPVAVEAPESSDAADAAAAAGATDPASRDAGDLAVPVEQRVTSGEQSAAPADEPLPKPATWTTREPSTPWCAEALRDAVTEVLGTDLERVAHVDFSATVRTADWHAVVASRRGRRHAHMGDHREDAAWLMVRGPRGVMVVADGAGSALHSRVGSAVAAHVAGHALVEASSLDTDAVANAVQDAHRALLAIAERADVAPKTLRTTLLLVAWEDAPEGTRVVATQVGDGAVVVAHTDGRVTRPFEGDAGEWSGEVHSFLPDAEAPERGRAAAVLMHVPDLAALIAVTDGIEDPLYPFVRLGAPVLSQLVHGVTAPLPGLTAQAPIPSVLKAADPGAALLDWFGFEKRGENDDRTLGVAVRTVALPHIAPWAPSPSA